MDPENYRIYSIERAVSCVWEFSRLEILKDD